MLRLNLGCGKNIRDDCVNVDLYIHQKDVVVADILRLPFADCVADMVICNYVLEHISIEDEGRAFAEIVRVLKVGGKCSIRVPDFPVIIEKWRKASETWRGFGGTTHGSKWQLYIHRIFSSGLHKNGYSVNKLKAIFGYLNLEVMEIGSSTGRQCKDIKIVGRKNA